VYNEIYRWGEKMSKKVQVKQKFKKSLDEMKDCVIFMTAYSLNKYNKKLSLFRRNEKVKDLLSEYHISSLATQDTMHTQNGRLKYMTQFDPYKQSTKFHFDVYDKDDSIENYQNEINQMSWILTLTHSMELLLDKTMFKFSFFINMDRFLVSINSRLLQVDPIAYFLNNMVFVNYELIDYNTGVPLRKDEIYGQNNNYNNIPVDGIQYFDKNDIVTDTRKISDIIFDSITGFFEKLTRHRFQIDSISYVHNLFVISNYITDIETYFLDVLGAEGLAFELKNINTSNAFKYYSQEYLGVVTSLSDESKRQALFDCQLLEVLKMYFYLSQIVISEITNKLTETINNQMHIDRLSFVSGTPIITLNAIDNMKQTESFKRYKTKIDFKISFLSLLQERRKSNNALLLNVLLYILTFIGGIGALQVLQTELGWSFKVCAVILTVFFVGGGIFWVWQERKK